MWNALLSFLLALLFVFQIHSQTVFSVNSNRDTRPYDDPQTPENEADDGICRDSFGQCSLRAALMETSNGDAFARLIYLNNPGTISLDPNFGPLGVASDFSILGNGKSITGPNTPGPIFQMGGENIKLTNVRILNTSPQGGAILFNGSNITIDSVTIEQTGAQAYGISAGLCSTAVIKRSKILNCGLSGISASMIDNLTIEDNQISGCGQYGIQLTGVQISNVKIRRNLIGTNASGTGAMGNTIGGISVTSQFYQPTNVVIGGNSRSDKNIISGNNYGIQIMADNVTVKNNFIGTNTYGTGAVPNTTNGIVINGRSNIIEDNVISGNSLYGIMLHHSPLSLSTENRIAGNIIGGKATDTMALPNAIGIFITGLSVDNIVGSGISQSYTPNAIVYNSAHGIYVNSSYPGGIPARNALRKNSFHDNGLFGVKVQSGTQGGILQPVLDSLSIDPSGNKYVYGHGAQPNATIDLYRAAPDANNSGEGKDWLKDGTADASGNFNIQLLSDECAYYTVMQTDNSGNSSEFSNNLSPVPKSTGFKLECNGPFIAGVSYSNQVTLSMNWKGVPVPARRVVFYLNGANQQNGSLSGDEVKATFDMALLHSGNNQISWEIFGCDAAPVTEPPYSLCAIDKPVWLLAPSASCSGGNVEYTETLMFPETVVQTLLNIPPGVDFISGALSWAGAPKYSATFKIPGDAFNAKFNTSFSLLGFHVGINGRVNARTQLNCTGLQLTGNARISGNAHHTFNAFFDLESYLPSCTGILSWPLLNDGCEALHDLARSFRASAEVGGNISLSAGLVLNPGISLTNTVGAVRFYVKPELDILWLHVRGKGEIKFKVKAPEFDLIDFSGSLKGKIYCDFPLPLFRFSIQLGPWYFSPNLRSSANRFSDDCFFTDDHGGSGYYDDESFLSSGAMIMSDSLLLTGVPNDTKIDVAAGANGMCAAVWSDLNSSFPRPSGDITVKVFDGSAWKPEVKLQNDINADAFPQAAFTSNNSLVVVWEHSNSATSPQGTDYYLPEYLKQFDIAYSVINPVTGTILKSGTLGIPGRYNQSPRLMTALDGTLMAIWQTSNGTTLFGKQTDPLAFYSAKWTGTDWSSNQVVADNLTGIHNWDCAIDSLNKGMFVYTRDMDAQFGTFNDREIFAVPYNNGGWAAPLRITNDNRYDYGAHCAYTRDGRPALTWLKDSAIVGVIGNLTSPPQIWVDSLPHGIEYANAKIACIQDTILILYPEGGGIYYSYANVNDRVWAAPDVLYGSEDVETSPIIKSSLSGKTVAAFLQYPWADSLPGINNLGRIRIFQLNGAQLPTKIENEEIVIPSAYKLYDPYPNPFNNSTRIRIDIPADQQVSFYLFDILGRQIKLVKDEYLKAGQYEFTLNASELPSGAYILRVTAGKYSLSKKLVLMK